MDGEEPIAVTVERSPGKNAGGFPGAIDVQGEAEFTDAAPPAPVAHTVQGQR